MPTPRLDLSVALLTLLVQACAAPPVEPAAEQIAVDSSASWHASGVRVSAGQSVRIEATGEYVFHTAGHTTGPAGIPEAEPFSGAWPATGLPGLALVARIGESGEPFLVGDAVELEAPAAGELMFMVNDDILTENAGILTVTVTAAAQPAEASAAATPAIETAEAPQEMLEVASVGLRMSYPEGWREGGVSGETVLASLSAGRGLYPGLNVTLEQHDGSGPGAVTDVWIGMLSEATVTGREELEVSGRPAVLTDVSWSSVLGSLRAMRLIVARGDDVLVITFADRAESVTDEMAAAYRAHLDSVTLEVPE